MSLASVCSHFVRIQPTTAPKTFSLHLPPAALVGFALLPVPGARRGHRAAKRKKHCFCSAFSFGGEGGTRTLAPVSRPTPLAGAPRHQLEYFSTWCRSRLFIKLDGGESGIRTHGSRESLVFKTSSLNRSDISPYSDETDFTISCSKSQVVAPLLLPKILHFFVDFNVVLCYTFLSSIFLWEFDCNEHEHQRET